MNGLEKFLLDENLNDQTFNSSYRPIIIHKEKYNDRFTYVFTRDYNEYLSNQAYRLSAYLDVKDKVIYDTDWTYLENTKDNRITMITCIKDKPNQRLCVQAIEEK